MKVCNFLLLAIETALVTQDYIQAKRIVTELYSNIN